MTNPAAIIHHGNANASNKVVIKRNSNNRFTLPMSLQSAKGGNGNVHLWLEGQSAKFANGEALLVEARANPITSSFLSFIWTLARANPIPALLSALANPTSA
jgi:hypothetical protein